MCMAAVTTQHEFSPFFDLKFWQETCWINYDFVLFTTSIYSYLSTYSCPYLGQSEEESFDWETTC